MVSVNCQDMRDTELTILQKGLLTRFCLHLYILALLKILLCDNWYEGS